MTAKGFVTLYRYPFNLVPAVPDTQGLRIEVEVCPVCGALYSDDLIAVEDEGLTRRLTHADSHR